MAETEGLMAATVRLVGAAEAAAALAANVRVRTEGLAVDPEIDRRLGDAAELITGAREVGPGEPGAQVVGMVRALLREAISLVDDPGRAGEWSTVDEGVLQGIGRLSMAIAGVFGIAARDLPGLGHALASPGARLLDVGTGTAWLAIATARTFPNLTVTGIDIYEPALRLARTNVDHEGMAERVLLELCNVTELAEAPVYDAIWLPLPFIPKDVVPLAIRAAVGALKPGGWLLPGTFAGPPDPLSRALVDLRTVRSGGHPWSPDELVALLSEAGLQGAAELPRSWPAPVRLWAAHRR